MAQVTLPYTLTAGTPENVNNLMSNLTALRDGVNTIDTAQIANGAVTAAKLASGVGSMSLLDSQTFTSSTTYAISASAKILVLEFFAAGGGGGGGGRYGSGGDALLGGNGGAGGGYQVYAVSTAQISGTVTVTVGAGGTAGAGATVNDTAGVSGGQGGDSRFGSLYFPGGSGGALGQVGAETRNAIAVGHPLQPFGRAYPTVLFGMGGVNSTDAAPTGVKLGAKSYLGGGGGGAGGFAGASVGTNATAGGKSETVYSDAVTYSGFEFSVQTGGGGAAGTSGGAGTAGTSRSGGGGGAARQSATAGAGGAGATPSGGGGGGGAGKSANGGAGGAGGRAEINLWVYG